MKRNLSGVFVNDAQDNPLQPDVQYRGFVGSPLPGLPQGIAVYQDGVRVNEPFGDTVNWALVPESAIDTDVHGLDGCRLLNLHADFKVSDRISVFRALPEPPGSASTSSSEPGGRYRSTPQLWWNAALARAG